MHKYFFESFKIMYLVNKILLGLKKLYTAALVNFKEVSDSRSQKSNADRTTVNLILDF